MRVTELQTRILEALERYRFLTASQFQELRVSHSLPVIWRALRELSSGKRSPVGTVNFPARMRVEHVERVHFLTPYGAGVLADILGCESADLDFCQKPATYHRDYWHRKFCVDFHIWLIRALEAVSWDVEVVALARYFDRTGANRSRNQRVYPLRAKTRVELDTGRYLIPDVTFVLERGVTSERVVYCMEMTNGRNTKRILTQMAKHAAAMRSGILSQKYGVRYPHRVLFLFSEEALLRAVERRVAEKVPADALPLVFLGHIDDAKREVLSCWHRPGDHGEVDFVTGRR